MGATASPGAASGPCTPSVVEHLAQHQLQVLGDQVRAGPEGGVSYFTTGKQSRRRGAPAPIFLPPSEVQHPTPPPPMPGRSLVFNYGAPKPILTSPTSPTSPTVAFDPREGDDGWDWLEL